MKTLKFALLLFICCLFIGKGMSAFSHHSTSTSKQIELATANGQIEMPSTTFAAWSDVIDLDDDDDSSDSFQKAALFLSALLFSTLIFTQLNTQLNASRQHATYHLELATSQSYLRNFRI